MRCTLKDGVFFTPKKKKSPIKSKREQSQDIILVPALKVKQDGKGFAAIHTDFKGTWAECLVEAKTHGYSGVREIGGLARKKMFVVEAKEAA